MGPADREKVRLECNQFFPERCINMTARQLGKGEGPAIVPKPSELSAEGRDGAMWTVGARETSWRRCGCSRGWKEEASLALFPASNLLWVPATVPPKGSNPDSLSSRVTLGKSPHLPGLGPSSVKQDHLHFP